MKPVGSEKVAGGGARTRCRWTRWLALTCFGWALLLASCQSPLTPPVASAADSHPTPSVTHEPVVHDPGLLRADGVWWVFGTGGGIQRLRSEDGVQWTRWSPVFDVAHVPAWWQEAVPEHRGLDVWAPEPFMWRGQVWLMYAISTFGKQVSAIGLAHAEVPGATQWVDDGWVVRSQQGDSFNAIDPDVFQDTDGRLWLTYGSWWDGIRQTELDPKTLRPRGETHFVAQRARGLGLEAPVLMHHGADYFLFTSWDVCCQGVKSTYHLRVGRAALPQGPFVDREGRLLTQGGGTRVATSGERWKGPGGADASGDWLAWHVYDAHDEGRPKLRLARLAWTEDGWPSLPP